MQTVTLSANTSWYLYNFRASTIRRLLTDGYHVICLAPEDDYSHRLVDELQCEWQPMVMSNQGSNPLKDIALIQQFWRYYRQNRPIAALHFTIKNNVYGTWAARLLQVPAINNVSGLGTAFIHGGLISHVVRLLYKTSQPFAHQVFCQNAEDFALLINNRLVNQKRLELLPGSGVDLQRFTPSLRQQHSGPLRFLYAGRMLADKGLNELVAAVQAVNQNGIRCNLWLCGFAGVDNVSAITQQQLQTWGQLPGITWLGPSDAMETIYAKVDCVVLPSYREGMPRSLLEAGAMGLPVIATDVPGCRNVVKTEFNGLLCAAKNTQALHDCLQQMLAMHAVQRQEMGNNGHQLVTKKFDEQLVVEATLRAVKRAAPR